MFSSEAFFSSVAGAVIGGILILLVLKGSENKSGAVMTQTNGPSGFNKTAAEEKLSKLCPCGNCNAFDQNSSRDFSGVRDASNVQDEATDKIGCVLLSSWLPVEIEVHSGIELCEDLSKRYGTVDFTYSSLKELRELVQLHHETQLLCFQLHVEESAGQMLLPLLEKLDPSDSAFVPLYRLIHGLLCGGGKVFPAMILDNW